MENLANTNLFFYIQYVAAYSVWFIILTISFLELIKKNEFIQNYQQHYFFPVLKDRRKIFPLMIFIVALIYITIQTHWILQESQHHHAIIEWVWSLFETFAGALLLRCLLFKQCQRKSFTNVESQL